MARIVLFILLMSIAAPSPAKWSHVAGWWQARERPNVMLVHFNSLKADMEGEIRRIAGFLDIDIDESAWPAIVEHSSFDWMKRASAIAPPSMIDDLFGDGASALVHKGVNGRWKDVLSNEEIALADQIAAANLPPACAHWLKTGELPVEA